MNLVVFKHLEVYNHHKTLLPSLFISNVIDALPSLGLNPLEGPTMLSCGKVRLKRRSRLPALKRGRGVC
jgi:hypothetical protein